MAERRFYQGETFANYDPGELLENAEFEDCMFDHCRWLGTRVQNCLLYTSPSPRDRG